MEIKMINEIFPALLVILERFYNHYQYILWLNYMGANNSNNNSKINKNRLNHIDEPMNQQIRSCCGISLNVSPLQSGQCLYWQQNSIIFCETYKENTEWIGEVVKLLKIYNRDPNNITLTWKFRKQFNDIRHYRVSNKGREKEGPLTQIELTNFKNNFRNSVLLHLNEIKNKNTEQEKLRQNKKIQTAIEPNFLANLPNPHSRNSIAKEKQKINPFGRRISSSVQSNCKSYMKVSKNMIKQSRTSFYKDSMSTIFKQQQQQISKANALSLQFFIKYSLLIEKQLKNPENQLHNVILCFYNCLYECQMFKYDNINAQIIDYLVQNIKCFIVFLTQSVQNYYQIEDPQNKQQENIQLLRSQDNLLTIITTILFKNEKFYTFLFDIVKLYHKEEDQKFNHQFESLHGKSPQHFFIKKQYSLNSFTLNSKIEGSFNQNNQLNISQSHDQIAEIPYLKSSQILSKLDKARTPIGKMKTILQCSQSIIECISHFYKNNNKELRKTMVDADQILSIFCYILSINKIQSINSHMFIIDNFATQNQKISITGYYFSVLACAIGDFSTSKQIKIEPQVIQGRQKTLQQIEIEEYTQKYDSTYAINIQLCMLKQQEERVNRQQVI